MVSIIIVDDDKDLANSMADLLKLSKFDVVAIGHDGKDAVTLFNQYGPDCVILDYQMPHQDGFYALKEIRKISKDHKIIMMTGYIDSELRKKLLDYGVSEILKKPVSCKELCASIQQ